MKYIHSVIVGLVILIFIIIQIASAQMESLTYDEPVHALEGIHHLVDHTFAIDTNNPPLVREILAIPLALSSPHISEYQLSRETLFPSRFINIFLGVILLLSTYFVALKYFGRIHALMTVFLLAFEPTMLAHSHYVTLDIGTSLFIFLSLISFLYLRSSPTINRWSAFAVFTGFAFASRITAIPIILATVIVIFFYNVRSRWLAVVGRNLRSMLLTFILLCLTVWSTYFFKTDVIVASRADDSRVSSRLLVYAKDTRSTLLYDTLWLSQHVSVPLGNYLATIKNTVIRGMMPAHYFFAGKLYQQHQWYFMPVNLFMKTPLALWIFLVVGLFTWRYKKDKTFIYFLIPFGVMLLVFSLDRSMPLVRYALPLYPFLVIIAARGAISIALHSTILFTLLMIWFLGGTIINFPHFISYANELAGRREDRYRMFTDSNIDWGQSLSDLATYSVKTKSRHVSFSYFGRDNGNDYGLASNRAYGSYIFEDICAFHEIELPANNGESIVAISVSNWYGCGFYQKPKYQKEKIVEIVGESILIFPLRQPIEDLL